MYMNTFEITKGLGLLSSVSYWIVLVYVKDFISINISFGLISETWDSNIRPYSHNCNNTKLSYHQI